MHGMEVLVADYFHESLPWTTVSVLLTGRPSGPRCPTWKPARKSTVSMPADKSSPRPRWTQKTGRSPHPRTSDVCRCSTTAKAKSEVPGWHVKSILPRRKIRLWPGYSERSCSGPTRQNTSLFSHRNICRCHLKILRNEMLVGKLKKSRT